MLYYQHAEDNMPTTIMDAAHAILKKTALFPALALIVTAPGLYAQTPQFNAVGDVTLAGTGGAQVAVSGTNDSAAQITFTASIQSTNVPSGDPTNWVSVTPSGTTPATIQLSLANLGAVAGTYTAVVKLHATAPAAGVNDITFNVTFVSSASGGGGGGTGGTILASPNPLALAATNGFGNQATMTLSTASTSAITFTVTTNPTNATSWLNVFPTTGTVSSGTTASLTVNVNATGFANTTLNGSITVSPSSGTATQIPVTVTVGTGSGGGGGGTLTFTTPNVLVSNSGSAPSPQTLAISNSTASTYSATVNTVSTNNGVQWLLVNNQASTSGFPVNAGITISGSSTATTLSTGTYTSIVNVTDSNGATGSFTVTLSVNGGGSGGGSGSVISVAPTSLTFSYQTGTSITSALTRQTLALTGPAGTMWNPTVTTTDGGNWLQPGTSTAVFQSDGTSTLQIAINPKDLTAKVYNGTVTVNTNVGAQSIPVTLTVTASPVLVSNPGSVVFNFHTGDTLQPMGISLSTSDVSALSPIAATTTPWITVSQAAGSNSISVSAIPGSMAAGLYSGSVTVTQAGLANSPLTIPVALIINGGTGTGGGGTGALGLNPASLTFTAQQGSSPTSQTISVTPSANTNFTVIPTTTTGGNWLFLGASGGVTPATVSVSVLSSTLAVGSYNGTITFTATNGTTQTVPVILNVTTTGGGGGGNVTVTPMSLTFSGQAGAGSLPVQSLDVESALGSSPVSFTVSATTTSGGNWLSSAQSGVTLSTPLKQLTVNVNVAGLAASATPYTGAVTITPTGGTTVSVPVSLTVTAPAAVSATPTTLTFAFRAGDAAPASQPVSVTGGGAALAFTATAASTGNWLSVSPATGTTGTTPVTVNVSVNPANLNASATPYTGTVTIAGSGGAPGSSTIAVSLTVTAPLPTVAKLTNAGSFATGSISPGEIITLFASDAQHPIGPATAAGLTLDSTGKQVATTIGGVQVLINGFAAPMVFANATQVSAVVPYELAGFTSADVLVKFLGQTSNAVHVNVATTAPGLFTLNSSGTGPGAILNSNNSVNSPTNPATKGDLVVVYLTGEGQTSPLGVTGKVTTVAATAPLTPGPLLPVSVLIGPQGSQQPATFVFAGEAPGIVSGVMQLNVRIPAALAGTGEMPIFVSVGGNQSQTGVTVSVK